MNGRASGRGHRTGTRSIAGGLPTTLIESLASRLRERLIAATGLAELSPDRARDVASDLIEEEAPLLGQAERSAIVDRILADITGLGVLEPLMADADVDEIMVNGPGDVYVERAGRIERTDVAFESADALANVVERILARVGRRVDEAQPMVDARLPDGSRVNCVIPPLSLGGQLLTIRRFRRGGFSAAELVEGGTLDESVRDLLEACVRGRANILVSGGTGSGKTTTLNALSEFISAGERIVTVEDAAELSLRQPHVLRLESRPANLEGRGSVSIRDLVRNALRMRPDRIIVGEVRGGEALDMLQAMNTGHEGSLTTVHANSPRDALRRIETLALMADVDLPHLAIQQQVRSAIDVVVHQARFSGGARRITAVAEVTEEATGGLRDIYRCEESRSDAGEAPGACAFEPPCAGRLADKVSAGRRR